MAKKENSLAHTKWMCKYHIIFTPKYRRRIIYNQYKESIRDILKQLCNYKGVEIILSVFAKFRSLHRLCLVTQNEFFANEVKQLNQNSEKQGFDILVGYIDENGMLTLYPEQVSECSENAIKILSVENFDGTMSLNESTEDDYKEVTVDEPSILTGWGQL